MSLRIAFMSLRSPLQFLSGKKCPLLLSFNNVMTLATVNLHAGVMENLAPLGVPVGCAERASLALNERKWEAVKREGEKRKDGGEIAYISRNETWVGACGNCTLSSLWILASRRI